MAWRNKKRNGNGIIDLFDGFDTILVLPTWFAFSVLVISPLFTCAMLTFFMREAITYWAEIIMIALFALAIAVMYTIIQVSGAMANAVKAGVSTVMYWIENRHDDGDVHVHVAGAGQTSGSGQQPALPKPTDENPYPVFGDSTWEFTNPAATEDRNAITRKGD